jgi:GT2 family glycosyltransferase
MLGDDHARLGEVVPTISFVIVTWNAKEFVTECLQSIRANCTRPAEIIVVDNASQDGTPERVRENFPECRLVQTGANLGFAKGNNAGIDLASGKYLFLVNSDVKILPGCVEGLMALMESGPKIGLAGPQMLGTDGCVSRSTMRFPTLWNSFYISPLPNFRRIFDGGLRSPTYPGCRGAQRVVLGGTTSSSGTGGKTR